MLTLQRAADVTEAQAHADLNLPPLLLTGQPFEQILDALHVASIPVRHLAGRSPWLTRQDV